ncbi:DEAD/DEAH box helicase [Colwellia psychrerythraea]|uniref:DEAD/DEAH box helicase domain protein n=1 Tax=Colwellia psychrerythraea TaxID=28229 RepID=A0A099KN10_COLPS|nr:DEAD/DEAH box helicase [Colwellia psychrerythraea]KGJ92109.1 DEAD/DEAH box helicase domain protein [Colwellia psychrerythraea]
MTFSSFSLDPALLKAITESAYDEPTEIQKQSIPLIIAKHDVMARAQTGTGKTAAFALPILQKLLLAQPCKQKLRVLVLTPTRELAQQVYKSFCHYGQFTSVTTRIAYGGVSTKKQITELKAGADILIATPGRLLDLLSTGSVNLSEIDTLVFDEADRMLDMGFKDEIARITRVLPRTKQTLLFSATFAEEIYKMSKNILIDPKLVEIDENNKAADDVEQLVFSVDADRKRELTSFLIGSRNWQQVLVFTRTKQCADELAKEMTKDGVKSLAIHGDKSQGARDKALLEFKQGKVRALIATDVAARGIDIKGLSHVINYELPYNAEDYVHRIGRTARAGNSGLAVSLVSVGEEWLLTAIEELLDIRLLQQWLPGYEPDLTKSANSNKKTVNKKNARKNALSKGEPSKNLRRNTRNRRK